MKSCSRAGPPPLRRQCEVLRVIRKVPHDGSAIELNLRMRVEGVTRSWAFGAHQEPRVHASATKHDLRTQGSDETRAEEWPSRRRGDRPVHLGSEVGAIADENA
jgi:hypothetical protein